MKRNVLDLPQKTAGGALLCAGPQEEKAWIRRFASRVGAVLLIAVGLQFVVAFADVLIGVVISGGSEVSLSTMYMHSNLNNYVILTGVEYTLYMGIPVLVGWLMFRRFGVNVLPTKRTDASLGIGLVLLGLGMMTAANFVGSYISMFFEMFDVSSLSMEIEQDGSASAMWLNVLVIGVLPGLLEELLFRGVILQGLRPAGDMQALLCSSLMFGLMHGTMSQIPFAFVLGLVFGYITLKTGNILWTMGLHAFNNGAAVLMEYWLLDMSDEQAGKFYLLFFAVETLLGVIGMAVLMMRDRTRVPPVGDRVSSWLTKKQRYRAVFGVATMIVFIVVMALITVGSMKVADSGLADEVYGEEETPSVDISGENQSARVFAEVLR